MIPLKDENPTRTFPFVTISIIVINALVFLYELSLGPGLEGLVKRFGVIPYELIHPGGLEWPGLRISQDFLLVYCFCFCYQRAEKTWFEE